MTSSISSNHFTYGTSKKVSTASKWHFTISTRDFFCDIQCDDPVYKPKREHQLVTIIEQVHNELTILEKDTATGLHTLQTKSPSDSERRNTI